MLRKVPGPGDPPKQQCVDDLLVGVVDWPPTCAGQKWRGEHGVEKVRQRVTGRLLTILEASPPRAASLPLHLGPVRCGQLCLRGVGAVGCCWRFVQRNTCPPQAAAAGIVSDGPTSPLSLPEATGGRPLLALPRKARAQRRCGRICATARPSVAWRPLYLSRQPSPSMGPSRNLGAALGGHVPCRRSVVFQFLVPEQHLEERGNVFPLSSKKMGRKGPCPQAWCIDHAAWFSGPPGAGASFTPRFQIAGVISGLMRSMPVKQPSATPWTIWFWTWP